MMLKTLAEKHKYICYWCKKKFPLDELSRDHIQTRTREWKGGKAKGECVLACIFCNQKRGDMPFEHFKSIVRDERYGR